jgi:trk system potassium uptake protein TrkH
LLGLFHSTTCRTAGFNTVDYSSLSSATLFLAILLMAIGAGPGSTGGGFKVSTFMTLLTRAGASFRGQLRANFAKRTIPDRAVERATATALVFVAIAIAALVLLLVVENDGLTAKRPRWFLDALFEVISALGTVGLSTGITPDLSLAGKTILITLMLLGRLGPITVAVALSRHRQKSASTSPQAFQGRISLFSPPRQDFSRPWARQHQNAQVISRSRASSSSLPMTSRI